MPPHESPARRPDLSRSDRGHRWDPLLYAGSARHYSIGRAGYPPELATAIVQGTGLDKTSTVIDIGCGPGALTILLAPHVARAIGVDPDADMLAEAARRALECEVTSIEWMRLRAEELPHGLTGAQAVTFAQSFHWMDRPRVAAAAREMLAPGGALVQVHATTHRGIDTEEQLSHPQPPWAAIDELVASYLGPGRHAGGRVLPDGTPGDEDAVFRGAGFAGPDRVEIPGRDLNRTVAQVTSAVYSLSSSAPHLFADRLADFDSDLAALLTRNSDEGMFSERMREIAVDIWR